MLRRAKHLNSKTSAGKSDREASSRHPVRRGYDEDSWFHRLDFRFRSRPIDPFIDPMTDQMIDQM
jgi:hypothetical protein